MLSVQVKACSLWVVNTLHVIQALLFSLSFCFLLTYQSGMSWSLYWMGVGLDYTSCCLLGLSALIIALSGLSSMEMASMEMTKCCISLTLALSLTFLSSDLLWFYIGFEASMIPMVYIILRWGAAKVRLLAAGYMVAYTLFSSLPLLWAIICLEVEVGGTSMFFPGVRPFEGAMYSFWWTMLVLAFLVKSPLYPFHLWLPKAHVEAPTWGSMILAGVTLKLGTYGLFRVCTMYPWPNIYVISVITALGVWGAIYSSFICLRLSDIKETIAYASVGHMGMVVAGIVTGSSWGWDGAFDMMLAHGLTSSLLFACAGVMVDHSGSRGYIYNRGFMNICPKLSVFMFIACMANCSFPPFPSFIAELGLVGGVGSFNWFNFVLCFFIGMLTTVYSLRLYLATQHGSSPSHLRPISRVANGPVYVSLIGHTVFLLLLSFMR
uniref:NADH dehydrogenase subunit 4 n=1 Tax=Lingula reevii TaxID=2792136 RepID=UPI002E783574|nr:NADH dehydrogenase subunit 4 [Lingula reevii]WQG15347.1 NADH dehydrogenase subunit 4 [Lingula reevii]